MGKPRKVDSPKKKKVEKPQDGRQKSGQNIGNPYQMEDNKNPKGAARSAAPLGRRRRRRLVVFHLVRISYVFASFLEPVLTPGIIFSPGRINFLIRAGENFIINVWGYLTCSGWTSRDNRVATNRTGTARTGPARTEPARTDTNRRTGTHRTDTNRQTGTNRRTEPA